VRFVRRKRREAQCRVDSMTDQELLISLMPCIGDRSKQLDVGRMYDGTIHASSVSQLCLREIILGSYLQASDRLKKSLAIHTKMTFAIGNAVHRILQNDPQYLGNRVAGRWKCLACTYSTPYLERKPKYCPRCKSNAGALIYNELELRIPGMSGHPDLLIRVDDDSKIIRLGEIKTMAVGEFESLKGPRWQDVMQLHAYMLLVDYSSFPFAVDTSIGYVLYAAKQIPRTENKLPFKFFSVRRRAKIVGDIDNMRQILLDSYDPILNEIKDLPSRTPSSKMARCPKAAFGKYQCPVERECLEWDQSRS